MLFFKKRELISITGAGGKTSLALVLGYLLSRDRRVVLTTTTHIGCGELPASMDHISGNLKEVFCRLERIQKDGSFFAVVTSGRERGKFTGFTSNEINSIFMSDLCDLMIVEADGAKGFPVKGYADYEPVIPEQTTSQIVVVGAEIFFNPLDNRTVFRLPLLLSALNLQEGSRPSPSNIALILESSKVFLKFSSNNKDVKRILLVNKTDLLLDKPEAQKKLTETLALLKQYDIACTSTLKRDGFGSVNPGCWIIDTNGEGQASSAIWRRNDFIICSRLCR